MKAEKHLGLFLSRELHYKFHYVAKYHGRSASGEIKYLMNQDILQFEAKYGKIEVPPEENVSQEEKV